MKKFILMIIAVSVFFIGVGGIVDQVGAKFESDVTVASVVAVTPSSMVSGEEINFESSKGPLIIKRMKDHSAVATSDNFEFNLRLPKPPEKTAGSSVEKSGEPFVIRKSFPQFENRNVFILKRTEGGELKDAEPAEGEQKSFSPDKKIKIIRSIRLPDADSGR